MLFTIVVILLTLLVLQFVYKQYRINKQLKGFVSPPGSLISRHLRIFNSETGLIPNLLDISRKYGGRVKLDVFHGTTVLLVADKDLMCHIFSTKPVLLKDAFYELCRKWTGDGIATCKPDKWPKTRKMLNPVFNIQQLQAYVSMFENPIKILIEKLKDEVGNDGFDVLPYLNLCTLDIICETVMGIKLNAQNDKEMQYTRDIHLIASIILRRLFSPLKRNDLTFRFTEDYQTEAKVVGRLRNFTQQVINERRSKEEVDLKSKNGSLLDILLQGKIDDKLLTDEQIIDETQTFLFAGYDTSATTVSLVLYSLSKHQDVQEKVVNEIESILGSDNNHPTLTDLNELRYLEMVIKETMRYYTVVPFISRLIDQDISLGDVFIPKGISVILFLYGLHMNPEYHPDPEKFDPSRFEKEITPYTFLPFGGGPRNCIGQRFSMLEMKCILIEILRNFRILEVPGHIPQLTTLIVLSFKNGMMIKLEPR